MLSEEKIKELADINWEQKGYNPWGILDFARAIEAAVLGEQAKAEPAAYKQCSACAQYAASLHCSRCSPLYLHPTPAPEGMVLVPREPTEAMLHEGLKAGLDVGFSVTTTVRQEIYRAMIAAADKEAGK